MEVRPKLKCKVMHIGNNVIHQNHSSFFELNDKTLPIENTHLERDLGVMLQNNLKWEEHISSSISKANFVLGRIRNCFRDWDSRTFKTLYTSYVRPILENGSVAWLPFRKQDIRRLEKVQRRATKLVPVLQNKSYEERLQILGITSLEVR